MKLIASMITRNEARRYLPKTLPALLEFCDRVLVIDDGSVDGTVDLIRSYPGTYVVSRPASAWDSHGEGFLRDRLLELTLNYVASGDGADWVLSIDADEIVADGPRLRRFLAHVLEGHGTDAAVSLTMREVWERDDRTWRVRVDGGWAPRECPVVWQPPKRRLSRAERWEQAWTIPRLKVACGREPEIVRLGDWIPSGVDLLHLGWSNPDERQARYDRYMKIDGGRFHADAHLRSILEPPTLVPYPVPEVWR